MNIIPYSNEKQQVVNLLIELQEYLVSVDDEKVQTIDDEYTARKFYDSLGYTPRNIEIYKRIKR